MQLASKTTISTLAVLTAGLGALALAQGSRAGAAAPFVPRDDSEVVERVPAGSTDPRVREENELRRALSKDPTDLPTATRLARLEIDESRARSDPRYLGRAQAALGPWWDAETPPPDVLLLRATIRQSNHDFEGALADLDAVLRARPADPQAWVTRSVVLTVRADYDEARVSCKPLAKLSTPLVAQVCISSVDSMTGHARTAYADLERAIAGATGATPLEEAWAVSTLGEVALRMGDHPAAERHFSRALAVDPNDSYTLGAFADMMLDLGRTAEVVRRLADRTENDGLLLRLVLAEQAARAPEAGEHAETLRARYDASHRRGDTVHRREEARFVLAVDKDPQRALELAKANWTVQRETWDARALLEAAIAAHDRDAARPVLAWLDASHGEDPKLLALAEKLR